MRFTVEFRDKRDKLVSSQDPPYTADIPTLTGMTSMHYLM